MKFSFLKNITATALASILVVSTAACRDMSYVIKTDSTSVPVGVYIYNEYISYYGAKKGVKDTSESPLKQVVSDSSSSDSNASVSSQAESDSSSVDTSSEETDETMSDTDLKGSEWIKKDAMDKCKKYLAVESKMQELNISLTDDELKNAKEQADKRWPYYSSSLKNAGVSKDSFELATDVYEKKYDKTLDTIYDKGGSQAVSDDEFNSYFTQNYVDYEYISRSLMNYSQSGSSQKLSDDKIAEIDKKFNDMADQINKGKDIKEASDELSNEDTNITPVDTEPKQKDKLSLSDDVKNQFEQLKPQKAVVYKTDNMYYILYKKDINEDLKNMTDGSDTKIEVLKAMKQTEFDNMLTDYTNGLNIEYNNPVIRKYSPSFLEEKAISSSSKSKSSSSKSEHTHSHTDDESESGE